MAENELLRRTPLYDEQVKLGGKFVPFAGYSMPVQFSGLVNEHLRVRSAVGLFDVSHMGEVRVTGPGAFEYLQRLTTNDVAKLFPGKAQYSLLLYESGGVVDDIIVYMIGPEDYFICVNASNRFKDYDWLRANSSPDVTIADLSDDYAQIAVQGPHAAELIGRVFDTSADELSPKAFPAFTFKVASAAGNDAFAGGAVPLILARTGYTGEDGFEVFLPAQQAAGVWNALLSKGADLGVLPCGLGARDTLRLEASYPLYGHELLPDVPALSSGVGWVVKFDKDDFIGKSALLRAKAEGLPYQLCGVELLEPGIVREGAKLLNASGEECGWVTSGTRTPTIAKSIGMALVKPQSAGPGTELIAQIRDKEIRAQVIKLPFYKRPTTASN